MSGLKERLERLRAIAMAAERERREAEGGETAPAEAAEREQVADGAARHGAPDDPDALHPGFRRLGVELVRNEAGAFLLRTVAYPFPYRHGRYALEELLSCAPRLHPIAVRQNAPRKGRKASDAAAEAASMPEPAYPGLLFLDTETTGLGVGTGNVPFMIGIGTCRDDAFVVEQGLIRDPGEERAMLTWLTRRFQGITHLVTFNGRSFDWPVLVGRYILNGWRRTGPEPGHLDFLHPSRALWKNTLPTCRLGTIEEARLGISRGEDVPGSLAPELYMRFLRDGNPEHLSGVFVHNENDVLTLAALAVHFGHLLGDGPGAAAPEPVHAEERFRTGAWLEQHGQPEQAQRLYDRLAEDTAADAADPIGWRLALAAKYKRLGRWERALPLWEQAARLSEAARLPKPAARLELAMYHEHRSRDYAAALAHARSALDLVRRRMLGTRALAAGREELQRLERRIARLERKLARQAIARADTADEAPLQMTPGGMDR